MVGAAGDPAPHKADPIVGRAADPKTRVKLRCKLRQRNCGELPNVLLEKKKILCCVICVFISSDEFCPSPHDKLTCL